MSSRTDLSPVMSSPGRPRAERGGKPEPAMMIAPALPCPPAVDSVLNTAAMPAAPTVANGTPVVDATAAAPAVVAAVWKKAAGCSGHELSARECAVVENFLDDERRGDRAEHNPERDHDDTNRGLQRINRRGRVNVFERRVGHEIENALRDERGDGPAKRPEQTRRRCSSGSDRRRNAADGSP